MTEALTYEDLAEAAAPSTAQLGKLSQLCHDMEKLEADIAVLADALKAMQAKLAKVAEADIPELLAELRLSEVKLEDGTRVYVKEWLRVYTAGQYRNAILSWLEREGYDDIIKDEVVVPFAKGQSDAANELVEYLKNLGRQFDRKRAVAQSTFAKLLRELIDDGENVPLSEFGADIQKRAKIQRPK